MILCDRCGTEIKTGQNVFEIKIPIKKFGFIGGVMTRELCERCYKEFFDYFYNYDKEKNNGK
jgi:hypothetical protein